MPVSGLEGLTTAQVHDEVSRGARFVVFPYTVSLLIVTLSRASDVHFVRAGSSAFLPALPYMIISFCFGWWGFPFGLIYTPISLFQCLSGGKDVTGEVMARMPRG